MRTIQGKDIYVHEQLPTVCKGCGGSCPTDWKPGEPALLAADYSDFVGAEETDPNLKLYHAVCISNDQAELVFRILEPGEFFDFLVHYRKGSIN